MECREFLADPDRKNFRMKKTTSPPVRLIRCLRIGIHLFVAIVRVALVYPFIGDTQRLQLKQRWSRQLLDILCIRLDGKVDGVVPGTLFVGNHISWLDIFALNALRPVSFVAKSEVRSWPLIGWLVAHTGNLFIRRGNRQDAIEASRVLARHLGEGRDVAIFPEGTTSDGLRVLEFRGALLQAAIDSGRPLQAVALAYYDDNGQRTTAPAYAGETTLLECLLAILSCPALTVSLSLLPPVDTSGRERRELADFLRKSIARQLGLPEDLPKAGDKPFLPECLQSRKDQ